MHAGNPSLIHVVHGINNSHGFLIKALGQRFFYFYVFNIAGATYNKKNTNDDYAAGHQTFYRVFKF